MNIAFMNRYHDYDPLYYFEAIGSKPMNVSQRVRRISNSAQHADLPIMGWAWSSLTN